MGINQDKLELQEKIQQAAILTQNKKIKDLTIILKNILLKIKKIKSYSEWEEVYNDSKNLYANFKIIMANYTILSPITERFVLELINLINLLKNKGNDFNEVNKNQKANITLWMLGANEFTKIPVAVGKRV